MTKEAISELLDLDCVYITSREAYLFQIQKKKIFFLQVMFLKCGVRPSVRLSETLFCRRHIISKTWSNYFDPHTIR